MKEQYNVTKEKVKQIYESSVNRLAAWMENHDVATITAFRNVLSNIQNEHLTCFEINGNEIEEYHKFSLKEKRAWNQQLHALLLSHGYGVTKIKGSYLEKGMDKSSDEESFFVVNLKDDQKFKENLLRYAEYFNQDSILYKEAGNNQAYLIGTNGAEFPGYREEVPQGNMRFIAGRFMSKIKNAAFAFATDTAPVVNTPDETPDDWNDQILYKKYKFNESVNIHQLKDEWVDLYEHNGINFEKPHWRKLQAISSIAVNTKNKMMLQENKTV